METENVEIRPLGEAQRLTGVFHSPGSVFGDIAANGRWWLPVILLSLLAVGMMSSILSRVSVDQILDRAVATNERFQQLPADQKEQALSTQRKIMPAILYGSAALGQPVVILVCAAALLFIFNLMMDAGMKFKNALNITAYSFWPPGIVGIAAMIAVLYLKPPDEFDIQNALAFNAGAFLPASASAWSKALAGSIDLFSFWTLALLAIGFSSHVQKMTFGKALGAIALPWLLWIVLKTGWAAMFG